MNRSVSLSGLCVISCPYWFRCSFRFWAHSSPGKIWNTLSLCVPVYPKHWAVPKGWKDALIPFLDISLFKSRSFCCMTSEMGRMPSAICINPSCGCWQLRAQPFLQRAATRFAAHHTGNWHPPLWNHLCLWAGEKRLQNKKHIDQKKKKKALTIMGKTDLA